MALQTIAQEWAGVVEQVIKPAGDRVNPVQVREMQRSFYAGALVILANLHELGGADLDEVDGLGRLQAYMQECTDFFASAQGEGDVGRPG